MTDKPAPYKNIYQRLHAAMKDISYVQKEEKQVNGQYRFVSHDAVTALTREALHKQDVIYFLQGMDTIQDGNRTEIKAFVVFACIDKPEDRLAIPAIGYGIDSQDKGPGKAISYLVKYALLKTLALETGDDPEKDSIEHKPRDKKPGKINPVDKTGNRAVDDAVKKALQLIKDCVDEESTISTGKYHWKYCEKAGATEMQLSMIEQQEEAHLTYLRNKNGANNEL